MKKLLLFSVLLLGGVLAAFRTAGGGYVVGDQAVDFKLKNVDGKSYSLAGIEGAKGYIVIFTCNHCPYAKAYEDRIVELHKKYAPLGYPVVAINPNDKTVAPEDSFDKMVARAKAKNFPFLYLYDESQETARAYGATRTPHVYLLDGNRTVRYIGAIDDNHEEPENVQERFLENAIDALRAGKEIEKKETRAIGCTIKWKRD